MNVIEQARQAYAPTQVSIRTERSVEAQLISQITARIRKAAASQPQNFPALVAAIHDNRRMWTTMAADVADGENGLPGSLRAKIFIWPSLPSITASVCSAAKQMSPR